MNNEMITILEAYQLMGKPKVKEVNKTVVKEETSSTTTSSDNVSGNKEEVKEAGEVASEPGSYVGFTGKIRTPGVYGTVENATFTIDDTKNVSWSKGTWLDGTWSGRGSFWNGGTWKNGTWKTGYWGGGVWENGIHQGGIFAGGTWKNGTWDFGVFDEGIWEDGVWKDGDWAKDDTKWIKGRDAKGVEHTDAPFHWGGMKYSKVTDPSKAAIDREKSRYNKGEYTQGTAGIDTFDDDDDPGKTYGNVGFKAGMKKADINITDSVKKYVKSPIFKQIIDSLEENDNCKISEVKEESPDTDINDDSTKEEEDDSNKVSESFDNKEKLLEMIDKMSDEDIEKLSKYVEETYFKI